MKKRKILGIILSLVLIITCSFPSIVLDAASIKDTTYYVQFNSCGGTYVLPEYNIGYGDTIDLPSTPFRYNYWFRGWYSDATLTIPFTNFTPIYQNTILYAKWELKSSTPNIMSQKIASDDYSSIVTIDITGQLFGSACQMNLVSYKESDLKNLVQTVNKTSKFIGFELNINDFVFDKSKPIPIRMTIPSEFNGGCTQILYTTDMESIAGIPDGYLNNDGEYVFDAYYSGTYILMEALDQSEIITDPKASLSITVPSNLHIDDQYGALYQIMDYPGDESELTFKWYSSKPYIAHISQEGIITAKDSGRTTISCVSSDGTFVARKIISVYKKRISSIHTNSSTLKIKKGKKSKINVSVSPSLASAKNLTFSSTNKNIATVNYNGTVTAKKTGICHIKIKSTDGSKKKKTVKIIVVS